MELAEIHSKLESAKFTADEVTQIASTVLDEEYWLKINTDLCVASTSLSNSSNKYSDRKVEAHSRDLAENGYTHIHGWLEDEWVSAQRVTLERLVQAGWPRVFLFVYSSAWEVLTLPPIRRIIGERLGAEYFLLPNIWVQHVEAVGQSGFAPHIDGCYPDAINFWIPLTDAGLEHAPMYVVRRTAQTESIDRDFASRDGFEQHEVIALLKNSQALPARVGDILVWDNHLIHWGAAYENGSIPRISMSLLVGHPIPGALALQGIRIPSFEERLRFIADALLRFTSRDLSVWPFGPVASAVLKALG